MGRVHIKLFFSVNHLTLTSENSAFVMPVSNFLQIMIGVSKTISLFSSIPLPMASCFAFYQLPGFYRSNSFLPLKYHNIVSDHKAKIDSNSFACIYSSSIEEVLDVPVWNKKSA
jgi:hypothetical protein